MTNLLHIDKRQVKTQQFNIVSSNVCIIMREIDEFCNKKELKFKFGAFKQTL